MIPCCCHPRWLAGALAVSLLGAMDADETLELKLRRLEPAPDAPDAWRGVETTARWSARHSAVVVCDMWDRHWCQSATARVAEMAPRMDAVLENLRRRGVFIIHCPSDTLESYTDHPARQRAKNAPRIDVAALLAAGPRRGPVAEPELPIDDGDGGCDDQPQCPQGNPWRRQIGALRIDPQDAITDSAEAFALMRERGITNVMIMGVHQNMCVLGRPFAIRQMVRLGQNVVLMRDLTDCMYNPRRRPFVDHFVGNDLVTWHIEKHWCPTITSDQVLGGKPFRFAADTQPPRVYAGRGLGLGTGSGSTVPSASRPRFEETFAGGLQPGWTWLRENPAAWRLRDGALEIRVLPGNADTVVNALVRPAPDRRKGQLVVEVTVRNHRVPTQQYEQAGITWYSDGKPVFKLVKELVDGQLVIVPNKKPMTAESVQLRIVFAGEQYTASYRPQATGEFIVAATGTLPIGEREEVSLQAYHGPSDVEHWIRFDDFRILTGL